MKSRFTIVIIGLTLAVACAKKDVKTDGGVSGLSASAASAQAPSPDEANDLKKVYFDTDKSTLTAEARRDLISDVAWLKKNSSAKAQIEGNCDERGSDEYNRHLGQRRADTVKRFLIHHGVARKRLTTISNGESQPVDPGHDETAWRQNRRVAFRLNF